jgi:hypothetical protein
MALRHVAWLRFKDGVSPERIENHMVVCRLLVGRVPVLENLECGPNLTGRSGGFALAVGHYGLTFRDDRFPG